MSPMDKLKSVKGENFQGEYLVNAKERNSEKKQRAPFQKRGCPSSASKAERRDDCLRI